MTGSADLFLHLLERFNRKERFYLVAQALGKPRFELSSDFRDKLSSKLGLRVPYDCFVAMDYHLDWIYAAAYLSSADAPAFDSAISSNPGIGPESRGVIRGNQEDIDLIVAFAEADKAHLLLVEAKGVASFGNKQLDSKAARLKSIFGDKESGRQFEHIEPHFVLASPLESEHIHPDKWPSWMHRDKVAWVKMDIPDKLLAVTRCDSGGNVSRDGDHWKIVPERTFRAKAADVEAVESATA